MARVAVSGTLHLSSHQPISQVAFSGRRTKQRIAYIERLGMVFDPAMWAWRRKNDKPGKWRIRIFEVEHADDTNWRRFYLKMARGLF